MRTKENQEPIVVISEKIKVVAPQAALVTIELLVPTANRDCSLTEERSEEVGQKFTSRFFQFSEVFRKHSAAGQVGGDNLLAEAEYLDSEQQLRSATKEMADSGFNFEELEARINHLTRGITIGETHFGEVAQINKHAAAKALEVILDVYTTPEE